MHVVRPELGALLVVAGLSEHVDGNWRLGWEVTP